MEYVDNIHGIIKLPDYVQSIIATRQFQRLKGIHQLGLLYKNPKFPKAKHKRYEHCIGTYYLAGQMLDALEKNTKGLGEIPDLYRKGVLIAALLHDIGHGPFSHAWEHITDKQYNHEESCRPCVDAIFENDIEGLSLNIAEKEFLVEFVKSLINASPLDNCPSQYLFLYDIVANKQCKVDVDKWDYLLRDNAAFGESQVNPDEIRDVFLNARASDDRSKIEYRYSDFHKLYNIFVARYNFHKDFYQKPENVCLENILKQIIKSTESDKLETIDGIKLRDIRANNMETFLKFDDEMVLDIIKKLEGPPEVLDLVKALETTTNVSPVPEFLIVKIKIKNAGEEMKEDTIPFYGDPNEKPEFTQDKEPYEFNSYFKIDK